MLVLGRFPNESVVIKVPPSDVHREIKVTICSVRHGRNVGVGIDAEKDIVILRTEVKERAS